MLYLYTSRAQDARLQVAACNTANNNKGKRVVARERERDGRTTKDVTFLFFNSYHVFNSMRVSCLLIYPMLLSFKFYSL